jgi:hypothetical protein
MRKLLTAAVLVTATIIGSYILYSHYRVGVTNAEIKAKIAQVEDAVKAPPPQPIVVEKKITIQQPPLVIRPTIKDIPCSDCSTPPPPPPRVIPVPPIEKTVKEIDNSPVERYERERQVNIELIGVLKLQINESNSWETVLKILVLILVSYGGIKYINRKFQ